jgi:hypothetical protein
MHGVDRDEVLSPDWEPLQQLRADHRLHPAVDEVAAESFRHRSPPEIVGSGYVVKSVEAALWSFHSAEHVREAVLKAVNLENDADTTGSVCGQLAGAYRGVAGIPRNGSTGWPDAKSSKGRSGLNKPLVADGQRRQDGDRKGESRSNQVPRKQSRSSSTGLCGSTS